MCGGLRRKFCDPDCPISRGEFFLCCSHMNVIATAWLFKFSPLNLYSCTSLGKGGRWRWDCLLLEGKILFGNACWSSHSATISSVDTQILLGADPHGATRIISQISQKQKMLHTSQILTNFACKSFQETPFQVCIFPPSRPNPVPSSKTQTQ